MRILLTSLLILAICLYTGGKGLLVFWYHVANGSFEQTFCENLAAPQLDCHGKCTLTQLLEDSSQAEKEKPVLPVSEESQTVQLLEPPPIRTLNLPSPDLDPPSGGFYLRLICQDCSPSVFRPPNLYPVRSLA